LGVGVANLHYGLDIQLIFCVLFSIVHFEGYTSYMELAPGRCGAEVHLIKPLYQKDVVQEDAVQEDVVHLTKPQNATKLAYLLVSPSPHS
jgi:hypothetical protein